MPGSASAAARMRPDGKALTLWVQTVAGLTEQRAAELCGVFMDGHLYRLLVLQRGWSTAEFTSWLSGSLAAALLRT
jgi:hypothetical protein